MKDVTTEITNKPTEVSFWEPNLDLVSNIGFLNF